ncbi:MAG: class I SAM-dependent methyltransferase [Planctomycetales bacterium]
MSTVSTIGSTVAAPRIGSPFELEEVDCLLCGRGDYEAVLSSPDRATGIGREFHVVRCLACGLHYTNPRPTAETIGPFYPDDYRPWDGKEERRPARGRLMKSLERAVLETWFGYPRSTRTGWLPRPLAARLGLLWIRRSRQRQSWIPWRAPGRLLDFGCGGGNFLVQMREFGWNVQGMDVSPACARAVTARTGIPVHVGTLPHPAVARGSFDVITLWNSLEHVHHPRATVQAVREALAPGGLIVGGVPNIDSWTFRQFGLDWHPLDLPRHLTHFTPPTLSRLLEAEGFRVLSIEHVARPGFLRHSVELLEESGRGSRRLDRLRNGPLARAAANRAERHTEADFIRAVAMKAA